MTALPELLDDLARQAPPPTVDVAAAWSGGRRQRRRRRGGGALAVAAVLGLLAVAVPALDLPDRAPSFARAGEVVDGHPERIGRQWLVRDLPDRPGPIAALLDSRDGWQAVRADGHRWKLPGVARETDPVLSPDGRTLGYLASGEGPYVFTDLVTGQQRSIPDVGDNVFIRRTTYGTFPQTPARWSPDSGQVIVRAYRRGADGGSDDGGSGYLLLDVAAATSRYLAPPTSSGDLAGWLTDDRLLWLAGSSSRATLLTTDLAGRRLREVPLTPTGGPLPRLNQWSSRLQPSTGRYILTSAGVDELGTVRTFSLESGRELAPPVRADVWTPCGAAAGDSRLVVPLSPSGGTDIGALASVPPLTGELTGSGVRPFTLAAPSVGAYCLQWADRALAGPGRGGGLLGTTTGPALLWWWKEITLGVVGVVLLGALARRRRSHRASRPVEPSLSWFD